MVGVGLAARTGIAWRTIAALAIIWLAAPLVAAGLGFVLTRMLDRLPPSSAFLGSAGFLGQRGLRFGLGPAALVAVGAGASFSMGANDVANATGALVGTGTFSAMTAGIAGGAGLAAGILTWGRPLLTRVAFDIVEVDRSMATAAQLVQAGVVLVAVLFGFFTSLNQALVGAMAGAGLARGTHTVRRATIAGIVRGWFIGPAAGVVLGYGIAAVARATGARLVQG